LKREIQEEKQRTYTEEIRSQPALKTRADEEDTEIHGDNLTIKSTPWNFVKLYF